MAYSFTRRIAGVDPQRAQDINDLQAAIESVGNVDLPGHADDIASGTALGHVKVGTGLSIDASGVLTASAGASALNDLTDVTITTPANAQVLTYNGSEWVNAAASGGAATAADVAKAYLAATVTSLAAATYNYPTLTEQYDYDNVLDPATATITIPTAGVYAIHAWAVTQQTSVDTSTTVEIWLNLNGTMNLFGSSLAYSTTRYISVGGVRHYLFAAGDTVRMATYGGKTYNLVGGGSNTYFGCEKVR